VAVAEDAGPLRVPLDRPVHPSLRQKNPKPAR
jgi:hypothetical protein